MNRQHFVGASDAAAVMGMSPWKSRYALWAEKVHGIEATPPTEYIEWGNRLEPVISDRFHEWALANVEGFVGLTGDGKTTITMPGFPFIACTPDRYVLIGTDDRHLLEIKTTDGRNKDDWKHDPPLHYQIQVQHQLLVTGLQVAWIAVLIGGNTFRVFRCNRNDRFIAALLRELQTFWSAVETQTPPEIDGSDSTTAAIKALHPNDTGETIELGEDWIGPLEKLEMLKQSVLEQQKEIAAIENRLREKIGDATYAVFGDIAYSYKTVERKGYTVQPSSSRVLRRTKRKESNDE